MKRVVINFGQGNLQDGCQTVTVQIRTVENNVPWQCIGSLPAAPELAASYQKWHDCYQAYNQNQATRISVLPAEGFRYSESEFAEIAQKLPRQINQWLDSLSFRPIERQLRTELARNEVIEVIIETEDSQLQQLPWHLWHFFADYPQAEIALSPLKWRQIAVKAPNLGKVRVLAILGNSVGIDVTSDREALKLLANTELEILEEPTIKELNEKLWVKPGWDIILFSGHSASESQDGRIYLNDKQSLTIAQLKNSLETAIANGLQIAIFNSCDGVGLAIKLADLNFPATVVMREPIPDLVAQAFLRYFLEALSRDRSFLLAIREARQRLQAWESDFPCASWLPLTWKNPTAQALSWSDLHQQQPIQRSESPPLVRKKSPVWGVKLVVFTSLVTSIFVMILRSLSLLEPLELMAYDLLIQQRPPENIDPRILVVEITESDTNRDRYPLQDSTLVKAIDRLQEHQPAAIGLDLHRAYARSSGYQELINRFRQYPNLFLVCSYGATDHSYAPPQELSQEKLTYQMGFSDLLIDGKTSNRESDRIDLQIKANLPHKNLMVRRQLLSYDPSLATSPSSCITPYSFSFQLAFQYLQAKQIKPLTVNQQEQWQFADVVFAEMSPRFGGYQNVERSSSQIPINYRSEQPGQRITLAELLSGKIEPQLIRDRIILFGYTAPVAKDYFETPYGTMPGIWIHGHMTSQMISAVIDQRPLIWVLPQWGNIQWGDWLWVWSWSIVGGIAITIISSTISPRFRYLILTTGVIILVLHQACLLLLINGGWMPYVPTLLSFLVTGSIIVICRDVKFFLRKA
ncbi:putative transmembrane sensor domain protein [Xenococcus sp. PCC 7305]|uniref:CHASE2 domain-containing protein n=1 Tax=Xenococcus sp. PCC 7305 TaxID=102125 RepID=UPI0002ABB980|nr:CHASE2 domain-containing protein [Xenococcus sp. PCC 7305]ELS00583.1 putative transmembrane sensor domain protein [Xenococcus sp. PCC 7305]